MCVIQSARFKVWFTYWCRACIAPSPQQFFILIFNFFGFSLGRYWEIRRFHLKSFIHSLVVNIALQCLSNAIVYQQNVWCACIKSISLQRSSKDSIALVTRFSHSLYVITGKYCQDLLKTFVEKILNNDASTDTALLFHPKFILKNTTVRDPFWTLQPPSYMPCCI